MTPYGPPRLPPTVSAPATPALGQAYLGQTFEQLFGWSPTAGDIIRLAVHGSGTWLGIHVALKESGFLSGVGWVIGLTNGVGALCDAISLGKRAAGTHPGERECPVP